MSEKVIVIGLDGATFDLLDPWIKDGKLPCLADIIGNGVKGELISTFPPCTTNGWPSIFTGKNPGKHGIFDLTIRKKDTYERVDPHSYDVDAETLWNILSNRGKKSGIFHVPMTSPPEKVNGFVVPGPTLWTTDLTTFPNELRRKLQKKFGKYDQILKIIKNVEFLLNTFGEKDKYLKHILYLTKREAKEAIFLMEEEEWDFFALVFFNGDHVQHHFWKYLDPTHPDFSFEKGQKWKDSILKYYQEIDNILGMITRKIGADSTLIIVSDHGAGPVSKIVYINHWLRKMGFLKLKEHFEKITFKYCLMRIVKRVSNLLGSFGFFRLLHKIEKTTGIKKFNAFWPSSLEMGPSSIVDWSHTLAYSYGNFGPGQIYINLKGREPEGIVNSGREYEELKRCIISKLMDLRDPETGEKIVSKIYDKEQIYNGPHIEKAPDIIFVMKDMNYVSPGGFGFGPDFNCLTGRPVIASGSHRMNGIFIVKGPSIKKGVETRNISILDIASTILHIMNIPIPIDMDGEVLTEIFEQTSTLAKRKIVYGAPQEKIKRNSKFKEEKEKMEERLRRLGYL